ncbi:unnamed protein product [Phytophthora lilii]|uniref:Unnamed protein product n=1 Tax=Phytophthora lilii TaxID=2077276 RepID=A0A9W6TKG6_9STRA|nr:unnamed protein product [Phytophthora lilii]
MPVHVLVVMEDQEPSGQNVVVPEADLNSSEEFLAFLENEMVTQDNVLVRPRVLDEESFKFRLVCLSHSRKSHFLYQPSCPK